MATELIVAIPTAGRPKLLARTLASLAQCELPGNYHETIVIENGPRCGAEQVVHGCSPVLRARYMYCPKANKSRALNAVLERAGDCLMFFTDDDVRFARSTLTVYAEAAAGKESGYVFGGPVGTDYQAEPSEWVKAYLPNSAKGWPPNGDARTDNNPTFLGANWAAFAEDLRSIGGFNPLKGPGLATGNVGQETDAILRLYRDGARGVYLPDAMVWHYVPAERCSTEWAIKKAYQKGVGCAFDEVEQPPMLLGVPRWIVRAWLTAAVRYAVASLICHRRMRFGARWQLSHLAGIMAGRRLARQIADGDNSRAYGCYAGAAEPISSWASHAKSDSGKSERGGFSGVQHRTSSR